MSKADNLRLQDVRVAYRLIGDCRDVGSDPALWYRRMFEGLYQLFGTFQASGGEGWWHRPGRPLEPISAFSVSGEPAPEEAFRAYLSAGAPGGDPIFQVIQTLPGRLITRTPGSSFPTVRGTGPSAPSIGGWVVSATCSRPCCGCPTTGPSAASG